MPAGPYLEPDLSKPVHQAHQEEPSDGPLHWTVFEQRDKKHQTE